MANYVFEGIKLSRNRVIILKYKVDGVWEATPVLTINDFKKEYIFDREFQKKGWFYERCMSCTRQPKEKWDQMETRLVFTHISHIELT